MNEPTPEALKLLRDKHDLNQVEVANLVYVSRRTVQYWEDGNRSIPKATWELLNVRLGEMEPVPKEDLLASAREAMGVKKKSARPKV